MHGKGEFTWKDGRKYKGDYVYDKKHGYGLFEFGDGRVYNGQWKDGVQHGDGEFFENGNSESRRGKWEGGEPVKWYDE